MSWRIAGYPSFIATDSALMAAEFVAYQARVMTRGLTNPDVYAAAYAKVFGQHDFAAWASLPPATIAHGITTMVREVGLFAILDDDLALDTLRDQTTWQPDLPPVHIARAGPIYTPTRLRQLDNRVAFAALVHRAAALVYAERLPSVPLPSRTAATARFTITAAMFDGVIVEAEQLNDGTARMLRRLRTTLLQLINARTLEPEDGLLVLASNRPSRVVAHLVYREAKQAPRIRAANPVAHPQFMPRDLIIPPWP